MVLSWFDADKVGQLELSQVVWWDETHKKCNIGLQSQTNCTTYHKFPRGSNGEINLVNGKYSEDNLMYLKVKYDDEVRFALGCAIVNSNGVNVGQCCTPIVYLGKTIVSIKDRNKKTEQEIQCV